MNPLFRDRVEAGRLLARQLGSYAGRPETIVLALPRGGVPVGFEVARALRLPWDVLIVRKLGVPAHEELAMGAIASGGAFFRNEPVIAAYHVSPHALEAVIHREAREVMRREQLYRGDRPPVVVTGKTVLVVDDGVATGSTIQAAVRALAAGRPAAIVVAAPVIAADTRRELEDGADEVAAVVTPADLGAIGQFYADFRQTTDEEVRRLLARGSTGAGGAKGAKPLVCPLRTERSPVKRGRPVPPRWAWYFRTLLALRDHLQRGRGDRLRDPGDGMEPPSLRGGDFADELYDRDLALALPANTEEAQREVNAALQRIAQGTYGICEATHRRIAPGHLRAMPWRRLDPSVLSIEQAK